jgi:hypothetical protein
VGSLGQHRRMSFPLCRGTPFIEPRFYGTGVETQASREFQGGYAAGVGGGRLLLVRQGSILHLLRSPRPVWTPLRSRS